MAIECDSSNVVKWVSNPSVAPWRFRWLLNQIENLKLSLRDWIIAHILREGNEIVDGLGKAGVTRTCEFVLVWD